MWLACAEDAQLMRQSRPRLTLPSGLETGQQLVALTAECRRTLSSLEPTRVLILDPETTNRLTFAQSRGRVTGETLLSLAAAEMDIACEYISRKLLRSRLGLPAAGKLSGLVSHLIADPMTPHWTEKRDLAALAALAGQEGDNAEG